MRSSKARSVTVGRVAQCEIHIDDQAVSRRHCTLAVRRRVARRHRSRIGQWHVPQRASGQVGDRASGRPDSRRFDGPRVPRSRRRAARAEPRPGSSPMPTRAMQSVVRKRIEPAEIEWLSSATSALPAVSLLAARAAASQDAPSRVRSAGRRTRPAGPGRRRARNHPRRDRRRSRRTRAAARRYVERERPMSPRSGSGIPNRARSR